MDLLRDEVTGGHSAPVIRDLFATYPWNGGEIRYDTDNDSLKSRRW
jgi:hypothetical protein